MSKDEAESMFFKAKRKNQLERKIKRFRFNRDGESSTKTLEDFCEKNDIIREVSAPYISPQNGVAERKNRTIKDMMNSMFKLNSI